MMHKTEVGDTDVLDFLYQLGLINRSTIYIQTTETVFTTVIKLQAENPQNLLACNCNKVTVNT